MGLQAMRGNTAPQMIRVEAGRPRPVEIDQFDSTKQPRRGSKGGAIHGRQEKRSNSTVKRLLQCNIGR
jgi:hypothetical protein